MPESLFAFVHWNLVFVLACGAWSFACHFVYLGHGSFEVWRRWFSSADLSGLGLGSFIPQPAESGVEEFISKSCPDAGVG